jgi:hypothetical protein
MADPVTTFIQGIKAYLQTYTPLVPGVHVDFVGSNPTEYALVMLPDLERIEEYIDHGGIYARHFMLNMRANTNDDYDRLQSNGFFEAFQDWLFTQSAAGTVPTLPSGNSAISIEATSNGFLFSEDEALVSGVYSISCRLVYERN